MAKINGNYEQFIQSKLVAARSYGFEVDDSDINPMAFPFQRDVIRHALRIGRYALFLEVGLGKTICQLDWAKHVAKHTGKPTLIVAPLAVADQTVREGVKFGYTVVYCRNQYQADQSSSQLVITNYEMLKEFDPSKFGGIVGDESGILKNYTGKTKQLMLTKMAEVEYRLLCTATPAPNDHLELGNHAEALGVMRSNEMISRWFINDTMQAGGYRLKNHAAADFWRWVSTWAVCMSNPADLGYDGEGYNLPPLELHDVVVGVDHRRAWSHADNSGQLSLLLSGVSSATTMHREKKATLEDRMRTVADIVAIHPNDYMVVWVETNLEADALRKLLPFATEVRGSEPIDDKRQKLLAFSNGETRVLITKPKIAAHGLNWQHCSKTIFASVTHKWEAFYQAMGRFHRYGQMADRVDAYIVHAESEGDIVATLKRKQSQHDVMQKEMINAFKATGFSLKNGRKANFHEFGGDVAQGDNFTLYHGDSCITIQRVESESIDISVYSPPFANLYIYSDAIQDMGNSKDYAEFFEHYEFLVSEKLRIHKPGTLSYVHCKDLPLYQNRDDAMGLYDFPGGIAEVHVNAGWELVGWKTIWKDPVIEMQRTKNAGLLWSSAFCERAERARQGMADYTLVFRKTDSNNPIKQWSTVASPLPYSVVERCVDLWSNEGENILSPYHDVGSGYIDLIITEDNATNEMIESLRPGRNIVFHVYNPERATELVKLMKPLQMVFHSRVALTDDSWLIVFRKWSDDKDENGLHVTHDLKADTHTFVGNDGPAYWDSDRDYSIQVWQRYASPVWYDLDGLPNRNDNIWMDIDQTNVLNFRMAREGQDEKHICPLQLDLIDKCLLEGSKGGDVMYTPFAGVGSELYRAIILNRQAVGGELKRSYFDWATKHLANAEQLKNLPTLFDMSKV